MQSIANVVKIAAEDQVLELRANYLLPDFYTHASVGVLKKIRAANKNSYLGKSRRTEKLTLGLSCA